MNNSNLSSLRSSQLLKIPFLPVPKKSKTSFELFTEANMAKAQEQLKSEGYNMLASYNNIPASGYHREANMRADGSKADIYYHTPDTASGGPKLRSKNDAVKYLKSLESNVPPVENIPSIDR